MYLENQMKCFVCGDIKNVPTPMKECEHDWEEVEKGEIRNEITQNKKASYWVYRCTKCKELKETRTPSVN